MVLTFPAVEDDSRPAPRLHGPAGNRLSAHTAAAAECVIRKESAGNTKWGYTPRPRDFSACRAAGGEIGAATPHAPETFQYVEHRGG